MINNIEEDFLIAETNDLKISQKKTENLIPLLNFFMVHVKKGNVEGPLNTIIGKESF